MRRLLLGLYSPYEAWRIPESEVARLRADFRDVEILSAGSRDELGETIASAEILFAWAPGEETLARGERVRWVHAPAAGIGAYLTPTLIRRRIQLTNSRGVHAIPIAEHTIAMLLMLAHRFRDGLADQLEGNIDRGRWFARGGEPGELFGKTLGLFGYGAIGREVARRAKALGMRVVAVRRNPERALTLDPDLSRAIGLPEEEPRIDRVFGPGDLGRMLEEADAVAVVAALTPETQGVFGRDAFARMKPGSWFVNVARGKIAREPELIEALRSGRIAGAALDVFETEPLPASSELYTLENVILTPHVSGSSPAFWTRAVALFRENLRRDLAGLPLLNRVDPERGY